MKKEYVAIPVDEYEELVAKYAEKIADNVDIVIGEHIVTGDSIKECAARIPLGFNMESIKGDLIK